MSVGVASIGSDFARARLSSSLTAAGGSLLNFTDGVGNMWRASAGLLGAPDGSALSLSDATVQSGSLLSTVTGGATLTRLNPSWCNSDTSLCLIDGGGLTVTFGQLGTCSSAVGSEELIVAWRLPSSAPASSVLPALLLQWESSASTQFANVSLPYMVVATLRLLTPIGGWSASAVALSVTLAFAAEISTLPAATTVLPAASMRDADQQEAAVDTVLVTPANRTQVDIKLQPTLPAVFAAAAADAGALLLVAVSVTLEPIGCALPSPLAHGAVEVARAAAVGDSITLQYLPFGP